MQQVICNLSSGGALDNILFQFGNAASNWQNNVEPITQRIFFCLFAMEFMWQLAVKKVFAGDVEKLWVYFFTRIVLCYFFSKYIINVELYKEIIEFFANLGSSISGYNISLNPGSNMGSMGPSEIISHFSCISDSIHRIADNTGTFDYITLKISLAIMQVVLLIVLSIMAFYLIKIILQAYFLLYAGFILTGFSGSSWTNNYWINYINAIAGIAIKFLCVCFILGILSNQMKGWVLDINNAVDTVSLSAIVLKVLISSIIFSLISWQVPEWASSILSSNVNMKLGTQITSSANLLSGTIKINNNNTGG